MESQHTEWKQSWRDEYLKWICGFANADGGVLVIGRNDNGVPVGIDNAPKLLEDLPNKIRDLLGIVTRLIANTFFRAGYIESWGRGIEKINLESKNHGVQSVDFNYELAGLMIQFTPEPKHLPSQQNMGEGRWGEELGETRISILKLISETPSISYTQLSNQLGFGSTAIEKQIKILRDMGCLKRIGPARGGHWEITQPSK